MAVVKTSFCVEFTHESDIIPNELKWEVDEFIKLMVKTDPLIHSYDLRGTI